MLLNEVTAYLVKAQALVIHIEHIGNFRRGILHLGTSIGIGEFTLAVITPVVLSVFVFAVFSYPLGLAVFTKCVFTHISLRLQVGLISYLSIV